MKLAIAICATRQYAYAMQAQARRVAANCAHLDFKDIAVILAGDASREVKLVARLYADLLPGAKVVHLSIDQADDGHANYKPDAQLLIARLRSAAFSSARSERADQCWSLDSDVLPPPNALRCSQDMLAFDHGFYSVSSCPYPNTAFLGGFGSRQRQINEDFTPDERKVPPELRTELDANEAEAKALAADKKPVPDDVRARWEATAKKVKECPPTGNIWEVIAKHGWRRRGWLEHAYPAIGIGAVVPSDWCGFGCTLLNREALALAHFDGYDGKGTEDLYICWNRWHPAGLRINVITHCPCDHVIWDRKKGGDASVYTHHVAFHEPEGELRGHLRTRQMPWQPER